MTDAETDQAIKTDPSYAHAVEQHRRVTVWYYRAFGVGWIGLALYILLNPYH